MIRFCVGKSRNVLVLGPLTFKFPKLWPDRLWWIVRKQPIRDWWLWYKGYLTASFGENFTEAKWAFRKKPSCVVPCILPLVVVNAYPTVQGVGGINVEDYLYDVYFKEPYSREFWLAWHAKGCDHTFKSNNNYALHKGEAKLLDYGAPGAMGLVVNHQAEFEKFLEAAKNHKPVPPAA